MFVNSSSSETYDVIGDCDDFIQEHQEGSPRQSLKPKVNRHIPSANLRKRSIAQNPNSGSSTFERMERHESSFDIQGHLIYETNPFLEEIEEVEYFDAPSEPQPLMEVPQTYHPQPSSAASARSHRLDLLYYIYRVLHAVLNLVLILFLILSLYGFVWLIKNDITRSIKEHKLEITKKVARCQGEFIRYECGPALNTPALKSYCDQLEACKNEDVDDLPLAQISVKALASILNGFFNELSYKSMAFFIIFMTVWIFASAILSWLLRPTPEYIPTPVIYKPAAVSAIPRTPSKRVRHFVYQQQGESGYKGHLHTSRAATPTY